MARTMVSCRATWRRISARGWAKASSSPKTSPGPSRARVTSPDGPRARTSTPPEAIRYTQSPAWPLTRISSPGSNSSSLESASSRSRSFASSAANRSEVLKAIRLRCPIAPGSSTGEAESQVGEAGVRGPGVPRGAAKLGRVRVPRSAARAAPAGRLDVGAPLPDVAGAVVEAVRAAVLWNGAHPQRLPLAAAVRGVCGDPLVSPGKAPPLVAARGAFPLRLAGKPQAPRAREGVGLVPADPHERLILGQVIRPGRVLPEPRPDDAAALAEGPSLRAPARRVEIEILLLQREGELAVGDGSFADLVSAGRHAPARVLVVLALGRVAAHPELAGRHRAHPHARADTAETRKAPGSRRTPPACRALRVLPLPREGDGGGEVVVGLVVGGAGHGAEDGIAGLGSQLGGLRAYGRAGRVLELHHPESLAGGTAALPPGAGHAHPGVAGRQLPAGGPGVGAAVDFAGGRFVPARHGGEVGLHARRVGQAEEDGGVLELQLAAHAGLALPQVAAGAGAVRVALLGHEVGQRDAGAALHALHRIVHVVEGVGDLAAGALVGGHRGQRGEVES